MFTSAFGPLSLAFFIFAFFVLVVAGSLIFYALQRNDEVRAKFGHGKTIFELETKKRPRESRHKSNSRRAGSL